ncbi:MAG: NAD-dependent epimerase/dehydratase family protein [Clostridia bacterium]|nr:NAD-dependent epimerase/dehydratase family protein [Clostridia bacterium]
MKILVIGGSLFLGRVFTIVACKEHELTLVNRGQFSMAQFGVREFVADRYDLEAIKNLPEEEFDIVVDFCAYNKHDIESFVSSFKGNIKKYIYISTSDVYKRGIEGKKKEDTPLEERVFAGETGAYIAGKIMLEKEIVDVCNNKGMKYGVIRPTIIYGPYNYAQKESEYVRRILNGEYIPVPFDSKSKFQMVYVKDVANAILETAKREENTVYNVCPGEIAYADFLETLIKVAEEYEINFKTMKSKTILERNELAPFPLLEEETEIYDGSKIVEECDFTYTSLEEGMRKTFNAFKNVYSG